MKIVNRKEFLELPIGTVYSKLGHLALTIKYETKYDEENTAIDWLYMEFCDYDDGDEDKPRLNLESCCRDGVFNEDEMFAIYDKNDVTEIIRKLTESLNTYK